MQAKKNPLTEARGSYPHRSLFRPTNEEGEDTDEHVPLATLRPGRFV
jgi:hypothetical protein